MTEIFEQTIDSDGVATLTWDLPGASMNVLTEAGILELEAKIPALIADEAVRGVILTSGKADFAGGMDLPTILNYKRRALALEAPAQMLFAFTMRLHGLFRQIERGGMDPKTLKGGKPFVWAAPGTGVGIGTELALACHRRIAAANPKARFGLPEIKIGIFPGGGGTTRLLRMLGLMGSAEFLLEGKIVPPERALKAGLIDEVVAPDALLSAAKAWIMGATEADVVKPWDQKGFKIPGGAPFTAAGFPTYVGGAAMAHGKTKGVYPAANAMLQAIYEGAMLPFDDAIRIEARYFTQVLMDPSSEAMIRTIFINKQALEKGAKRPDQPDRPVRKLGVLGAGMMGAGIARAAAEVGIDVVLMDRDQASADRGVATITAGLEKLVSRKRLTPEARDAVLSRITATPDYAALSGADLVVEAVFEDPAVKADVTRLAEAHLGSEAIFASNTSTLPIGDLAEAFSQPERFVGIHFFSPVDRMLLVEVIKGPQTGEAAIAKALDFVRQLRKTPIVVGDAPFFYANRCISAYAREGMGMVAEGIAPALIENAAKALGMPLGPLQLKDETSLELAYAIAKSARTRLGARYVECRGDRVVREMVETHNRLGRKAKAGFYAYDEKGKREGLWQGLAGAFPLANAQPDLADVKNRLILAQVLEAVRAYEAGVLTSLAEGDVGAVLGWGFAPWSGGPFGWIDMTGPAEVLAMSQDLETRFGPRFAPPALLSEIAASGETFYGREPG